jgi:hypothetical protein
LLRPKTHLRATKAVPRLERVFGPLVIDIFADDRRFGDDPAVMYKRRNHRVWIQLVFRLLRVAAAQIEVDAISIGFLFGQRDPNLRGTN